MSKEKTAKEKNKSLSEELLDSYRKALYKIKDFFDEIQNHSFNVDDTKLAKTILELGEKLGKNIETLAILEKKVQAEELSNSKIRGGAKLSLLESEDI